MLTTNNLNKGASKPKSSKSENEASSSDEKQSVVEENEEKAKKEDENRKPADKMKGKKIDEEEMPSKEVVDEGEEVDAEEKSAMQLTKITKVEANIKTMKTDELQTLYSV